MDLIVNVSVPSISENYDLLVPDFLQIGEIITLIAKAVEDMSSQRYKSSGKELLCADGCILASNMTLKQCNIVNGDYLMLF